MYSTAIGVVLAFLFVCMAILFCAILIKVYVAKIKKYNNILFEKQLEQQRMINESIVETQEQTLQSLAMELHDDTGQQLTLLNFQLERLALQSEDLEHKLAPVKESFKDLGNSIRQLSHSINNRSITSKKLVDSFQDEIDRLNRLGVVHASLQRPSDFNTAFSNNERIVLFRIFQEVMNNMLKYSRAKNFTVSLEQQPVITIHFKDDGIGFVPKTNETKASNGLGNMKSRATLIGYSFELITRPQKGTLIKLTKLATTTNQTSFE